MSDLAVWAPNATSVELVLGGPDDAERPRTPMDRRRDGWWDSGVEAEHGTDYAFSVDGGDPVPDPRSGWQPYGVHGPSRVFDTSRYEWTSKDWTGRDVRGVVLYELHVGTFTPLGTLDGAIARLDELVDLGVQIVSLMPLAAFPGWNGWGYDGVHLWAVHDPYGGPAALQRFVDAAHGLGLGVCLDVVYNHLGPDGNYLGEFGPYFTDGHETPWGSAVNLDGQDAREVREWIVENALRWFRDFGLDALRLDAVHALIDDSPVHVLSQLSLRTAELSAELGRPLGLIAESDLNDPRMVEPVSEGGFGMTAQWSDDFHHAVHSILTGERQGYYVDFGDAETLAETFTKVFVHDGSYSTFRGEDWGRPVDTERIRGHRFLAYLDNHDQVGNRAIGDRPTESLSPGELAIAAAWVLLGPYTPMLFMGEEWGATTPFTYFTDHNPELGALVRQGRRKEFAEYGWDAADVPDPQDARTRDASVLDWSERGLAPHRELLTWYRSLIDLRNAVPELRDDDLDAVEAGWDQQKRWFRLGRGPYAVLANLSGDELSVPSSADQATVAEVVLCFLPGGGDDAPVLAGAAATGDDDGVGIIGAAEDHDDARFVRLPGHGVAVVRNRV